MQAEYRLEAGSSARALMNAGEEGQHGNVDCRPGLRSQKGSAKGPMFSLQAGLLEPLSSPMDI